MSTQDASGVHFSILPEAQQQHFRLLELPPELLALLTSDDAPTLHLKSLENTPGQSTEQSAVLCTPNKTYTLRQVQTSNSLFVTELSTGPADEIPRPRLDAIAQSHFTLELQAANDVSAVTHIQSRLPVYASTGHYQSKDPISKAGLFGNIPAHAAECEASWQDLACFELDGEALIPSASVKLAVWQSMLSTATADSINLTGPLLPTQLETLVDLNDSQWPREIPLAVLRSMADSADKGALTLDGKKCARVVGGALLEDRTKNAAMAKADFLSTWADLLPEEWRRSAELSLLDGSYKLQDGSVSFSDGASGMANGTTTSGTKAPAEAKSALGAKRKWHDKFRASKKTA